MRAGDPHPPGQPTPTPGPPTRSHAQVRPVDSPHFEIFLCEASAKVRRQIHAFLQRKGHRVQSFESGGDLRRRFQAGDASPDLLILDLQMPDFDPHRFLLELHSARFNGQVALTTSSPEPDLTARCMQAFAHVCLTKPLSLRLLHQVIKQIKGARQVDPPAPPL